MKKFTIRTLSIIAASAFLAIPVAGITGYTDTVVVMFTLFFMSGAAALALAD